MTLEEATIARKLAVKNLKSFGIDLGDDIPLDIPPIRVIPTGFDAFDNKVIKIGGFPLGRLSQVYGSESQGKTTLALRLCAQAQRLFPERIVAYFDTEFTFDADWARKQGVDCSPDRFFLYQNNIIEEVLDKILRVVASGAASLAVIDSIGNLMEYKTADIEYYKMKNGKQEYTPQPGALAKKITSFVQQTTYYAAKTDTCVLGINQVRAIIGQMGGYGDNLTTPGGHAWKHDLSIDVKVRKIYDAAGNAEKITVGANVRKNKLAGPASTDDASHMIFYLEGGLAKSQSIAVVDAAVRKGLIIKSGAWYAWHAEDGTVIERWQGRESVDSALIEDAELRSRLEEAVNAVGRTG